MALKKPPAGAAAAAGGGGNTTSSNKLAVAPVSTAAAAAPLPSNQKRLPKGAGEKDCGGDDDDLESDESNDPDEPADPTTTPFKRTSLTVTTIEVRTVEEVRDGVAPVITTRVLETVEVEAPAPVPAPVPAPKKQGEEGDEQEQTKQVRPPRVWYCTGCFEVTLAVASMVASLRHSCPLSPSLSISPSLVLSFALWLIVSRSFSTRAATRQQYAARHHHRRRHHHPCAHPSIRRASPGTRTVVGATARRSALLAAVATISTAVVAVEPGA